VILDKCKQLSCEKIDDRITSNKLMKTLLNEIEIVYQDLAISRKTFRTKIQKTVRRLFDAASVVVYLDRNHN